MKDPCSQVCSSLPCLPFWAAKLVLPPLFPCPVSRALCPALFLGATDCSAPLLPRTAPPPGHPWVAKDGVAPDKPLSSAVLTRLKQFSAMNKLKKMALRVSERVDRRCRWVEMGCEPATLEKGKEGVEEEDVPMKDHKPTRIT